MVPSYINDMFAIGYQISAYLRKPSFPIRVETPADWCNGWVVFFEFSRRASGRVQPPVDPWTEVESVRMFIHSSYHGTILIDFVYLRIHGWLIF